MACLTTAVLSLSVVSLEPPTLRGLWVSLSLGTLHSTLGSGHPKCGVSGWYTVQDALETHFHVAKASAIPPFNMGFCQYLPMSFFFFFLKDISNGTKKKGMGKGNFLITAVVVLLCPTNTSINELQA